MSTLLSTLLLLICAVALTAADYCMSSDGNFYCSTRCCGSYSYRYCCHMSVGQISIAAVGSLIGLAILITVIVCCCIRSRRSSGIIVARNPQTNVTFLPTDTQNPPYYTPPLNVPYGQPAVSTLAPPPYNQVNQPQSTYRY